MTPGGDGTDPTGARIVDAALELLRSAGPRAVTMQAVTEATGIAKTTIYRRHRDRRALLTASLTKLAQQPRVDPAATPDQRLEWAIRQSVDVIVNGIGVGGFAALLTNEDPEFSDAFRGILDSYRAPAVAALDADTLDGDTVVDMIVGSYITEFARSGTVDTNWAGRVFTQLRSTDSPER
ncbi:TetR family transcriptional regulator [Mycobacterium sp. MS1601]|uniref:TetR/AcrR family transcriptional regulator n=1 Tax=Mycobacterium sp. MS1601 TaxID=1936029 RepID=UPI0009797BB3|nr:TetR/AcrR family transcriptional regulator [Mycobacterium sp. MS1601]AQA03468.1 TetR family transcriptional regulator [Mycobacterium sp. MS1601]